MLEALELGALGDAAPEALAELERAFDGEVNEIVGRARATQRLNRTQHNTVVTLDDDLARVALAANEADLHEPTIQRPPSEYASVSRAMTASRAELPAPTSELPRRRPKC